MKKEYISSSSEKTKKLGEKLAKEIIKRPLQKKAFIIGLRGELGGGKTTFLQGFARGLGVKEKILSPTFVILRKFKIRPRSFYHIDCYRIGKPKELLSLGFKEIVSDPQNIIAIEWADQIKKIMPRNAVWVRFEFISGKRRKIIFSGDFNFMIE